MSCDLRKLLSAWFLVIDSQRRETIGQEVISDLRQRQKVLVGLLCIHLGL